MYIRSFAAVSIFASLSVVACSFGDNDAASETGETEADLTAAGACRGKQAGDACSLCGPRQRDCVESQELKACASETYRGRPVLRCRPAPSYAPCAGKVLGDACTLCAPGDNNCVETQELKVCDGEGATANCGPAPSTNYAPCAGKVLGDACTLCAPGDNNCVETQELKVCDGDGATATCGSDGVVVIQAP
jgi:hypothetical protein